MALININPRLTAEENFRAILIDKGLTPGQAQGIINTFTNIVPVEPSEDMIMAGCMEHGGYDVIDSKSIYKTMIGAAP